MCQLLAFLAKFSLKKFSPDTLAENPKVFKSKMVTPFSHQPIMAVGASNFKWWRDRVYIFLSIEIY